MKKNLRTQIWGGKDRSFPQHGETDFHVAGPPGVYPDQDGSAR